MAIEANVPLELIPPAGVAWWVHGFSKVSIGNACSVNVKVYTDDAAQYVEIEPTYERLIQGNFDRTAPPGLIAVSTVAGTLVVIWS